MCQFFGSALYVLRNVINSACSVENFYAAVCETIMHDYLSCMIVFILPHLEYDFMCHIQRIIVSDSAFHASYATVQISIECAVHSVHKNEDRWRMLPMLPTDNTLYVFWRIILYKTDYRCLRFSLKSDSCSSKTVRISLPLLIFAIWSAKAYQAR